MKVILAIFALVFLSGCQESEEFRATLTRTCTGLAKVYAHYDAVAVSGLVSERTMTRVATIRQQTDMICASPETATTVSLTASAAAAYVALSAAFKESEDKAGFVGLENLRKSVEREINVHYH